MGKKRLTVVMEKPYTEGTGKVLAPVAQLDRVADFESEGCWFESSRARL